VIAVAALIVALAGTAFAAGVLSKKEKRQVGKIATKVFKKRIAQASVAHATGADTAATATNAEHLGGEGADQYQRAIRSSCPKNGAYQSIDAGGMATCIVPVQTIVMSPNGGERTAQRLAAGLELLTICHESATTAIAFRNVGSTGAVLSYFYTQGEGLTNSSIGVSPNGGQSEFSFNLAHIDGQFVWATDDGQVVTVVLHAGDASGSTCLARGTAVSAP
jgi:hypothetical protein